MARKPRIEYEGAFFHVITRGNQKQNIFKDPLDHRKFIEILIGYKQRYHFHLYAYILMSNHVHLLIETGDIPLSKILQGVNQRYTMYYNRRYKTVGHLFQGRYKAILCDRDRYLLALIKYIHYNPLRAKIAESLDQYTWSSHRAYLTKTEQSALLDTDLVLRMFSENKSRARKQYAMFMNDGATVKQEDIHATIDQRLLGDERFVEKVVEKHEGEIKKERRKKEYTLASNSARNRAAIRRIA
jgi:REP element-mobilizing transposase RayT